MNATPSVYIRTDREPSARTRAYSPLAPVDVLAFLLADINIHGNRFVPRPAASCHASGLAADRGSAHQGEHSRGVRRTQSSFGGPYRGALCRSRDTACILRRAGSPISEPRPRRLRHRARALAPRHGNDITAGTSNGATRSCSSQCCPAAFTRSVHPQIDAVYRTYQQLPLAGVPSTLFRVSTRFPIRPAFFLHSL